MTVATIDKDTAFMIPSFRTDFPPSKRVLTKEPHQASYVPSNQLPEEMNIKITSDKIEFLLLYSINEPTKTKLIDPDVEASIGQNTGRIFSLSANFAKSDYSAMLKRLDDIKESLQILRSETQRPVIKKTYDLLCEIVGIHRVKIEEQRSEIEEILSRSDTADK